MKRLGPSNPERHPAVRDALQVMRHEAPSDDSRRATLAALGLDASAPPPSPGRRRPAVASFALWFLAGLAFVALIAALLR